MRTDWNYHNVKASDDLSIAMNDLKVGYLCEPQVGGTYTTFTLLREPLKERGIDFRCICPFDGWTYSSGSFSKEEGVIFLPLGNGCDEDAAIITECLIAEGISILVVLPESYETTPPLVSKLPKSIKCIAHLDMITAGVYRPTRWCVEDYMKAFESNRIDVEFLVTRLIGDFRDRDDWGPLFDVNIPCDLDLQDIKSRLALPFRLYTCEGLVVAGGFITATKRV